jgi:hypothetical protein
VEENGVSAVMERGGEERSERTEWGEWKTWGERGRWFMLILIKDLKAKVNQIWILFYLFICLFIFGRTKVWAQGFTLAKQVLYCLSHISSLFCSGYFGNRISTCPGWPWTTIPLISASQETKIIGVSHRCPEILFLINDWGADLG